MEDRVASEGAQRRVPMSATADEPPGQFGARVRCGGIVSQERRRLGWVITLTGVAIMGMGAALMALSSM